VAQESVDPTLPPGAAPRAAVSVSLPEPGTRWAVGVSGGADSVALLRLLHARGDLTLHVIHLDHQARGPDSTADAAFVASLARRLGLPCSVMTRAEVEPLATRLPANVSARFRALRLTSFRQVIARERLDGVLLAHHADDVAETVLHRLLRGSGPRGLTGMEPRTTISGVTVVRPLLGLRRGTLRTYLASINQEWREDASNASPRYARNRLRRVLADTPGLHEALLQLSAACRAVRDWTRAAAPVFSKSIPIAQLAALPEPLAAEAVRRWLADQGAPPASLTPDVLNRLATMASDRSTSPRQHFPGAVLVRRRGESLDILKIR
jgi:tRNA(Ile)-lysidine synthetase-like protein